MKRTLSLILSLALLTALMLAPVGVQAEAATSPWLNSDIIGSVTETTEVAAQDNFAAYINQDWILRTEISPSVGAASTFNDVNNIVQGQLVDLMNGEAQQSHEGQLVQTFYTQYIDMDARNQLGIEPIMPMVREIQAISTLDELTAYMKKTDKLSGGLAAISTMADLKNSEQMAVYVEGTSLTLADTDEYKTMTAVGERTKSAYTVLYRKMLMRVGYTEAEATALIEQVFDMETRIGAASIGSSAAKREDYMEYIYNPVTVAELEQLSPTFPIMEFLKPYTELGIERFILIDKDWLAKINELYTAENLESFKAMLLCYTISGSAAMLDQECLDIFDEANGTMRGAAIKSNVEETAFKLTSSLLTMAMGKMYVENYVPESVKTNITSLVQETLAVYKERLAAVDWLSDATREKAIDKLDKMRIRVAYPDDWAAYDYSTLTFKTNEEGGTLISNVMNIRAYSKAEELRELVAPVDKDKWPSDIPPQDVNAFYRPSDNSINIPAGILNGNIYSEDASRAAQMGSIGIVIGHEITHAFDTTGSQYDADGNLNSWWSDEDRAAFNQRTQAVNDYYSTLEVLPGQYVDGQLTIGETVADLGGMSAMLEIARRDPEFNYDEFFSAYARIWAEQVPIEMEQMLLQDVHAPNYLRINADVQQFEEFYTTYDVQPGDGMYIAPEERLAVW